MVRKRKLRRRLPVAPTTWDVFEKNLAAALYDLGIGEYLVLIRRGTRYFVQFADHGLYGMGVEAVSNAYLSPDFQLPESAIRHLVSLGWNEPTYIQADVLVEPTEGSPNFFIDATCPVRTADVARLAGQTLREVYGVTVPSELSYRAYSTEYDSIRFSQLGIRSLDAFGYEYAAILEQIEPELSSPVQLPLVMPIEVS